jgi:reactive intermediate/imine deaminase
MRIITGMVCLFLAGLLTETTKVDQQREKPTVEHKQSSVNFVKSDTLPPSPGYSQAVEIRGGHLLYIAGQVAMDRAGKVVGDGDMHAQAQQTFENLKAALEASGAKFENVVKLNYYVVDITQLPVVREVRDKFINTVNPPASTAVEVKRLFRDPYLIEVEAIAVVPD